MKIEIGTDGILIDAKLLAGNVARRSMIDFGQAALPRQLHRTGGGSAFSWTVVAVPGFSQTGF